MRLFAAVWPTEEVLDHLDLALAAVRRAPAGSSSARWTAREAWHLTTAFYGALPDGATAALVEELATSLADRTSYRLELRGAGVFAHRTLWGGASGDLDAHRRVVRACVDAGDAVGAHRDERARDRPHLTVGRVRPGSGPPRRGRSRSGPEQVETGEALMRALAVYEGPSWVVDEVLVVESRPGAGRGGGPLYRPLERLPLA